MSKEKFNQAKELVEQKRYKEARTVLMGVDHPKVTSWLAMIDAREKATRSRTIKQVAIGCVAVLVLCVACSGVFFLWSANEGEKRGQELIDCINLQSTEIANSEPITDCLD